jgi:hypothetical protein
LDLFSSLCCKIRDSFTKKKSRADKANAVSRLRTNNLKEKVSMECFFLLFFCFLSFLFSVEIEIFGTIFSDYHMRARGSLMMAK